MTDDRIYMLHQVPGAIRLHCPMCDDRVLYGSALWGTREQATLAAADHLVREHDVAHADALAQII